MIETDEHIYSEELESQRSYQSRRGFPMSSMTNETSLHCPSTGSATADKNVSHSVSPQSLPGLAF